MFNEGRIDNIERMLVEIKQLLLDEFRRQEQFRMSTTNSLAALTTAVANETTVDQSVLTLITSLAAQIAAASPTGDNPAIDALVATMTTNATALAAAVAANTPAVVAPAAQVSKKP